MLVVAAVAALLWRLSHGPLSLDFLTPYVVRALEPSDGSFHVAIGATELVWTQRWNDIDVRVRDLSCTTAAGTTFARLPALAMELSVAALLRGEIAPSQIELDGPELRLVREPDGSFGLGLDGAAGDADDAPLLDKLLAGDGSDEGDAPAATWLESIVVHGGDLSVADRASGFEARADALMLEVERGHDALQVRLSADLSLGDERIPVTVIATRKRPAGNIRVELTFRDVDPAVTVQATSALQPTAGSVADQAIEAAARIGIALDGKLRLDLAPDAALRALELDATGATGTLDLPAPMPGPLRVERLAIDVRVDVAADVATLRHLEVDLGQPELRLSGRWAGSEAGALAVDASLLHLPTDALAGYWPADAAADARSWVTRNVTGGEVEKATVSLRGELPADEPRAFTLRSLAGRLSFAGLAVRYVDTMPEATNVVGNAIFSPEEWSFRVASARVAGLAVPTASVELTALTSAAPRIAVDARARGSLRDALALVDHEPLRYAHAIGIDPAKASGSVVGRVELAFPLTGDTGDLGTSVHAELHDAALPDAVGTWPLAAGDLVLDIAREVLTLQGSAKLTGVPCTVQWHEELAATSGITRRIEVKSDLDAAGRAALGFDLRPWLTGSTAVSARIEQRHDGTGTATIGANLTPAKLELEELRIAKPPGAAGSFTATLALTGGTVKAVDSFALDAGGATAHGSATLAGDEQIERLTLDGALPAASTAAPPPRFSLTLGPAPKGNHFDLTSEDASTLLRLLLPETKTEGGKLRFTGTIDPWARGRPFSGDLAVETFTLTESTALARIATLASLSGIESALRRDGIAFESLTTGIAWDGTATTFKEGVVDGKSLRLVFGGSVDLRAHRVAIEGTLVPPLYGLNAIPGKVPILGGLFGRADGGFIAIDFKVSGPTEDPKVSVQPLSSLAPGVLRSLMRKVPW